MRSSLLLLIFYLFVSCSKGSFSPAPNDAHKPSSESELLPSDDVNGKVSEESESIAGYSLLCQSVTPEQQKLRVGCLIANNGSKSDLSLLARSWTWSISFEGDREPVVSIEDMAADHPRWHAIYTFSSELSQQEIFLGARIEFSAINHLGTPLKIQDRLQRVLVEEASADRLYVSRNEVGVEFSLDPVGTLPSEARVFVKRNGIQIIATDMRLEGNTDNGRYVSEANLFLPGDKIEVRFYSATANGIQEFIPGPSENTWYPVFIY